MLRNITDKFGSIGAIVAIVMIVCLNATSAFGRELLDINSDWAFYRGDVENCF